VVTEEREIQEMKRVYKVLPARVLGFFDGNDWDGARLENDAASLGY